MVWDDENRFAVGDKVRLEQSYFPGSENQADHFRGNSTVSGKEKAGPAKAGPREK